jgi:hypothetical protein
VLGHVGARIQAAPRCPAEDNLGAVRQPQLHRVCVVHWWSGARAASGLLGSSSHGRTGTGCLSPTDALHGDIGIVTAADPGSHLKERARGSFTPRTVSEGISSVLRLVSLVSWPLRTSPAQSLHAVEFAHCSNSSSNVRAALCPTAVWTSQRRTVSRIRVYTHQLQQVRTESSERCVNSRC